MAKAELVLEGRDTPWTLAIEPWALAFDIPQNEHVYVTVFDLGVLTDDTFQLEVAEQGAFLHFWERRFVVRFAGETHEFDFA